MAWRVIFQNICVAEAPSIAAASEYVSSTPANAACNKTTLYPSPDQTETIIIDIPNKTGEPTSQGTDSKPSDVSI